MNLIGHAVLLLLAGVSGYLLTTGRADTIGMLLLFVSALAGIFLLDWWAFLTVFLGAYLGGKIQTRA